MIYLLYAAIAFTVFIGVVLLLAALRPTNFRVVRSARIPATPAEVFAQVNDLHKWETWSPWAKLDPKMKHTYEGAEAGRGSSYAWNGNSNVGEGRMTITESRPHDLVRIDLEFKRPFVGKNDVEFTFVPQGGETLVTWTMTGKYAFMAKVFGLIVNIDKVTGGMFEQGLSQLKVVVKPPQAA